MFMPSCRGCGGIYCENCVSNAINVKGATEKGCLGCFKGETPGEAIKQLAIGILASRGTFGDLSTPAAVVLAQGRQFGEGLSDSPPTSGYFELVGTGIDNPHPFSLNELKSPFPFSFPVADE